MWEACFNLSYNSQGAITLDTIKKMPKKKWLWMLKRLAKQKKDENDAIKKSSSGSTAASQPKGMRYLGNI